MTQPVLFRIPQELFVKLGFDQMIKILHTALTISYHEESKVLLTARGSVG